MGEVSIVDGGGFPPPPPVFVGIPRVYIVAGVGGGGEREILCRISALSLLELMLRVQLSKE